MYWLPSLWEQLVILKIYYQVFLSNPHMSFLANVHKNTVKVQLCPETFTMVWLSYPVDEKMLGKQWSRAWSIVSEYIARTPLIVLYEHDSVYSVNVDLPTPSSALSPIIAVITGTPPQQLSLLYCHLSVKNHWPQFSTSEHGRRDSSTAKLGLCKSVGDLYHLKAKSW